VGGQVLKVRLLLDLMEMGGAVVVLEVQLVEGEEDVVQDRLVDKQEVLEERLGMVATEGMEV
jgi:hypothetical protein